jgi:hypothetical protein
MARPRPSRRAARSAGAAIAAACLALPVAAAGGASPTAPDGFAARIAARARALLDEASAERVPPRRPPRPVPVKWKAKKLGAVDLGAPLVALTSGDLDGDGRAELVAVTEREIVVLAPQGRRALAATARAALPDEAPAIEPRQPVAAAVVVAGSRGAELRVRSSTAGRGARYVVDGERLRESGAQAAYPLCADREAELARGKSYFEDGATRIWAAACRSGLVDPEGRALRADAVLGAGGALGVTVAVRCARDEADCPAPRTFAIDKVGIAFAVADVDRDGRPEVITSAASAPGDPDAVTVRTLPASGSKLGKPIFTKKFSGGIGGIAADDVDGDGDIEVIAAVRLPGAERVDLWLLD